MQYKNMTTNDKMHVDINIQDYIAYEVELQARRRKNFWTQWKSLKKEWQCRANTDN